MNTQVNDIWRAKLEEQMQQVKSHIENNCEFLYGEVIECYCQKEEE